MTENKRFIFSGTDEEPLIKDNITGKEYPTEENSLMELLNGVHGKNKELKSRLEIYNEYIEDLEERNDRQAETIKELYTLIGNKDWKALTTYMEELDKCEEQLQSEWRLYSD